MRTKTALRCQSKNVSYEKSRAYGMTLIEIVLAIAIAGFVLTAAVSLLVSISSIWSERSERHFFADHVDGVAEFLNANLKLAGVEITADTGRDTENQEGSQENPNRSDSSSLANLNDEPIRWERPPGFASYQEPLLSFSIATAPPLLVSPDNDPILGITAFLYFEPDAGLSLLWHSILQEEVEDINDLRRTQISPLVKKINYIYWDERFEQWEEEDRPQKDDDIDDQYNVPRFVKLTFEYEGVTKERILTIPVPSRSALIF